MKEANWCIERLKNKVESKIKISSSLIRFKFLIQIRFRNHLLHYISAFRLLMVIFASGIKAVFSPSLYQFCMNILDKIQSEPKAKHKKIKKGKKNHSSYVFSLRSSSSDLNFPEVYTDFANFQIEQKFIRNFYPSYLRDNRPLTPSFFLPIAGYSHPNQNFYLFPTEDQENEDKMPSFTRPEPDPESRICGVCRKYYDDYFEHIESSEHKTQLKNCVYQKYIKNFCSRHYKQPDKSIDQKKDNQNIELLNNTIVLD